MEQLNVNYIVLHPQKSLTSAILLGVFLGPIGLLYTSFWGSIVMLVITLICTSAKSYAPLLILLIWLVCIYWNAFSTFRQNKQLCCHGMSHEEKDS